MKLDPESRLAAITLALWAGGWISLTLGLIAAVAGRYGSGIALSSLGIAALGAGGFKPLLYFLIEGIAGKIEAGKEENSE